MLCFLASSDFDRYDACIQFVENYSEICLPGAAMIYLGFALTMRNIRPDPVHISMMEGMMDYVSRGLDICTWRLVTWNKYIPSIDMVDVHAIKKYIGRL